MRTSSRAAKNALDPLVFVRHLGDDDVYRRGPTPGGTLYVVPGLWDTMPTDLLAALRARRLADVTGTCPACRTDLDHDTGQMLHDDRCAVSDRKIRVPLATWARRTGHFARGRRLIEYPEIAGSVD